MSRTFAAEINKIVKTMDRARKYWFTTGNYEDKFTKYIDVDGIEHVVKLSTISEFKKLSKGLYQIVGIAKLKESSFAIDYGVINSRVRTELIALLHGAEWFETE